MPSEKTRLDLIAQIYDAALDASLWTPFLEALSDTLRSGTTVLASHDMRALRATIAASVRIDPESERLYNQHYSRCDAWREGWLRRFSRAGPEAIVPGDEVVDPAELRKTEFYNDFLAPNHMAHQLCGPIVVTRDWSAVLSTTRPATQGPFGEDAVGLVRVLLPHLQKALHLHRTLSDLQAERDASLESLDLLAAGFILVDRHAHVLFANRAARRIVDRNDGLSVRLSGLTAAIPSETAAIRKLIYEAWITRSGRGLPSSEVQSVAVSRPSGRRRLSLLVIPVMLNRSRTRLAAGTESPAAAVLISDPETETIPDTTALRQSFALTPAEARLASILMTGTSLEEAGDRLGISANTAKTQLKAIFSKTGTSRQGELIRVLLLSIAQIEP